MALFQIASIHFTDFTASPPYRNLSPIAPPFSIARVWSRKKDKRGAYPLKAFPSRSVCLQNPTLVWTNILELHSGDWTSPRGQKVPLSHVVPMTNDFKDPRLLVAWASRSDLRKLPRLFLASSERGA